MARYRKIDVRMWLDGRFVALSPAPPNAQTLWIYLLTNPDTTSIPGLFRAGEAALAEALGWPLEELRRCFAELQSRGMATADWRARLVWIPNAIRYNAPENPNVIKSWGKVWEELPECALRGEARAALKGFLEGLPEGFQQAFAEAIPDGASKGFEEGFPEGYGESGAVTGTGTREGATASPPAPDGASRPVGTSPGQPSKRSGHIRARPEPAAIDVDRANALRACAIAADPSHAWAPEAAWRRFGPRVAEALRLCRTQDQRPDEMLDTVARRWGEIPAKRRSFPERAPLKGLRDDIADLYRLLVPVRSGPPPEVSEVSRYRPVTVTAEDLAMERAAEEWRAKRLASGGAS